MAGIFLLLFFFNYFCIFLMVYYGLFVCCFFLGRVGGGGLNGPLRQYFSLYRAVPQREGERKEK